MIKQSMDDLRRSMDRLLMGSVIQEVINSIQPIEMTNSMKIELDLIRYGFATVDRVTGEHVPVQVTDGMVFIRKGRSVGRSMEISMSATWPGHVPTVDIHPHEFIPLPPFDFVVEAPRGKQVQNR